METYPNLPTPAGRWAAACACGQPAALVHDGRNWCVSCHLDDVLAPRELPAPA